MHVTLVSFVYCMEEQKRAYNGMKRTQYMYVHVAIDVSVKYTIFLQPQESCRVYIRWALIKRRSKLGLNE